MRRRPSPALCACDAPFLLAARPDTPHFAERRCACCETFAGWCKRPEKMTQVELETELQRAFGLITARKVRASGKAREMLTDELVSRARRYVGSLPDHYRALLREAVVRMRKNPRKVVLVQGALTRLLMLLETADGWIEGELGKEPPRWGRGGATR